MIGVGVFTTSGFSLASLGSPAWVLSTWIVAGIIALSGAWSYSRLIQGVPESGGEYLFIRRAYGPRWGFVAGWISLIAGFTGAIAIAATALESYVLPDDRRPAWLPPDAVAIFAVIAAGWMHGWRLSWGAILQNLIVLLKMLLILVFLGIALAQWNSEVWRGTATAVEPTLQPSFWLAWGTTVVWTSFSFSGYNAAIYVVEESRRATQSVSRALLTGTVLVFAIYLMLNVIFVFAPAQEEIVNQANVGTIAARVLGGERLALAVQVLIAIALLSSITSMTMAGPRVYAKMADDGLLPAAFRAKFGAPRVAIGLQVALAIVIVVVSSLQSLLNYLSLTLSLSAAAAVSCLFVLPEFRGKLRLADLFLAGFFVACTLGLAILLTLNEPLNLVGTVLTVLSGLLAYSLIRRGPAAK